MNDLLSRIVVLDEEIEAFMLTNDSWNDDKYDENVAISEEYTDRTSRMIKLLEGRIELLKQPDVNSSVTQNAGLKLKLPQVDLPKFDNEPENFNSFRCFFEKMVERFQLSDFERCMHLLKCTSGNARKLLNLFLPVSLNIQLPLICFRKLSLVKPLNSFR